MSLSKLPSSWGNHSCRSRILEQLHLKKFNGALKRIESSLWRSYGVLSNIPGTLSKPSPGCILKSGQSIQQNVFGVGTSPHLGLRLLNRSELLEKYAKTSEALAAAIHDAVKLKGAPSNLGNSQRTLLC